MGNRLHWMGSISWVMCAASLAHGDTVQSFATPAGGTAYAQTDPRGAAPPEFTDFGDCSLVGPQRIVEGARSFLRLAHDSAPAFPPQNCNAVTFNCVEPAITGQVAIDFDFRVTNPDHGAPADGFSLSLVRAGSDLARGGPSIDVDEIAGPAVPELPDMHGSLGFGFRVYRDPDPAHNELLESVKLFWNGGLVQKVELPANQTMVDIGWIHAAIRVDFGQQQVSVVLTRDNGSELLRIPTRTVPGLEPYATRVHLAARSGFSTANFDFDEIHVAFPPRDPAVAGAWSPAFPLASVPIHAALLPGGKVLYWDRHDAGDGRPYVWDGVTSTLAHNMPMQPDGKDYDAFCAGHTFAADGSLFIAGGHIADNYGEPWASRFDPVEQHFHALPPMHAGRWYPTTTTLPGGDIIAVSGTINPFTGVNELPEVYDARANQWRVLTGAERPLPLYPFMFTTRKGLFAAGPMIDTGYLDITPPGRWIPIDQTIAGRNPLAELAREYGTAVLADAELGRILVIGGTAYTQGGPQTQRSTEWIDLSQSTPRWRAGPTMIFERRMQVSTLLPDGSVLVTGGTSSDDFNRADGAILNPELLTGLEDQWRPMACATEARIYHSIALLLPDARVLVAGGGHPGEIDHPTAEIFSPPYLFRGAQLPAPGIVAGPGVMITGGVARVSYGATVRYTTPDPSRVAAVRWLRPAAVTHAFNQDQRTVPLTGCADGIGTGVIAPHDPAIAPPGPYMMFLVDHNGVPSHAAWIRTNVAPDAADDVLDIVEDQAIPQILERIAANDVDVERDATAITIVEPPHHGQIVDDSYLPDPDFHGEDSFRYTVFDGLDISRIATATIRIAPIDDPPLPRGCNIGSRRPPPLGSCALVIAVWLLMVRRRRRVDASRRR